MDVTHTHLPQVHGEQILSVTGLKQGSSEVRIRTTGGTVRLHHIQECCETVHVEDIAGAEAEDLVGARIHEFRVSSKDDPDADEEGTWTFYTLVTNRADVTIRWYGESNGYYSTDVYCDFSESAREATATPALFTALEEPTSKDAYLTGANLTEANLTGCAGQP